MILLMEEIHQLVGKLLIIYKVRFIPSGAGFLPSWLPVADPGT